MRKEVAIIGAGPYGLSAAAYLAGAGIEPYVIGQPMVFWKDQMPKGMFLRSSMEASNIADPKKSWSMEAYETAIRRKLADPLPVEDFIAYGLWYQKQTVPNLDTRRVQKISQTNGLFSLVMQGGERIDAKSVVLALGIGQFAQRPLQFEHIPSEVAPHSSDLSDLAFFRGKRVAVIGNGQSALEYAALLHEQQAEVQILVRSSKISYLKPRWRAALFSKLTPGPLRPLRYRIRPPTDLGDIKTARMIAHPEKFRRQSPEIQKSLLDSVKRPKGSHWLRSRLEGVLVRTNVTVDAVDVVGDHLRLVLSDGLTDIVDRVVLATGYRVDVSRYHILDASLKQALRTEDGYPVLTTGLETSVPGLYMAGVIGECTLGPTLRFVTGTSNTGPRLAASIASSRQSRHV